MSKGERAPYIKFYVNDYLNDMRVASMTMEERGIYTTMLFKMWQLRETDTAPYLPNNEKIIAALTGTTPQKIHKFLAKYPELFKQTENGTQIYNKRLSEEDEDMIKLTTASQKANETRWKKTDEKIKSDSESDSESDIRFDSHTDTNTDTKKETSSTHGEQTRGVCTEEADETTENSEPKKAEHEQGDAQKSCPHKKIIQLYTQLLPTNPAVHAWPQRRKRKLQNAWYGDKKRQNIDWWKAYFEHIATSDFLTGRAENAHKRFDLEWFTEPKNMLKILEGQYHSAKERGQ